MHIPSSGLIKTLASMSDSDPRFWNPASVAVQRHAGHGHISLTPQSPFYHPSGRLGSTSTSNSTADSDHLVSESTVIPSTPIMSKLSSNGNNGRLNFSDQPSSSLSPTYHSDQNQQHATGRGISDITSRPVHQESSSAPSSSPPSSSGGNIRRVLPSFSSLFSSSKPASSGLKAESIQSDFFGSTIINNGSGFRPPLTGPLTTDIHATRNYGDMLSNSAVTYQPQQPLEYQQVLGTDSHPSQVQYNHNNLNMGNAIIRARSPAAGNQNMMSIPRHHPYQSPGMNYPDHLSTESSSSVPLSSSLPSSRPSLTRSNSNRSSYYMDVSDNSNNTQPFLNMRRRLSVRYNTLASFDSANQSTATNLSEHQRPPELETTATMAAFDRLELSATRSKIRSLDSSPVIHQGQRHHDYDRHSQNGGSPRLAVQNFLNPAPNPVLSTENSHPIVSPSSFSSVSSLGSVSSSTAKLSPFYLSSHQMEPSLPGFNQPASMNMIPSPPRPFLSSKSLDSSIMAKILSESPSGSSSRDNGLSASYPYHQQVTKYNQRSNNTVNRLQRNISGERRSSLSSSSSSALLSLSPKSHMHRINNQRSQNKNQPKLSCNDIPHDHDHHHHQHGDAHSHETSMDIHGSSLPLQPIQLSGSSSSSSLGSSSNTMVSKPSSSSNSKGEQYTCRWNSCGERLDDYDSWINHVKGHVGQGSSVYYCHWDGCPRDLRVFKLLCNIHYHIRTHADDAREQMQCKWAGCQERPFRDLDLLVEHIHESHIARDKRDTNGQGYYECHWDGCDRNGSNGFANRSKIIEHVRKHTRERPFPCLLKNCPARFTKRSSVASHMRRVHAAGADLSSSPLSESVGAMIHSRHNTTAQLQQPQAQVHGQDMISDSMESGGDNEDIDDDDDEDTNSL